MKVLYLIDSLQGYGAEKSLAEIIVRYSRVTPVVVQMYDGDELSAFLTEKGVKVYSLGLKRKFTVNEAVKKVISIIEKENPQILHSTLFRAEMVSRKIKKFFPGLKLIGSFISNSYSKRRYDQLSILNKIKLFSTHCRDRWSVNRVDYFVSNSEAIKATNSLALGVPKSKIHTIYRGRKVYSHQIENQVPIDLIELKDKIVFLNIGRLQPSKGQGELLLAFKKITKENSDAVLLIAGDGYYRKELETQIKNLELEEKVILLGYRRDIPQLLALADFFIFPSHFEGLSGALIEALFSRTPCILSDIPENRECVSKGSALFFKHGDIDAMKKRMEEAIILEDWSERTQMAYNFALEKFEIERISRKYEDFYLQISH